MDLQTTNTAAIDLETATRSIPRGGPGCSASEPAVDPGVWLDHVRYARDRNPAALDRLVREYERYARSLARRRRRGRDSWEDVNQVALEALVLALKRFDPERHLPFPAYGPPPILGSVRRHYRDRGWLLRVPRGVH